ncbi:c-type cytochrome biogenesis protein CcmI [Kaistia dalseonensis]|uniref:Cytochrome c-type biogenesis protein CcmH n=1 Tax=Kaistia dalseonensis TaxID=410840 RepID=A0ABU0H014_9HYPH|nr:c-type cytochrome biogenesis protein CcmI [Kaistia dalseonensis]MCX5493097.1 c-type cytochrome biogenesis protein CcmI [Kaistia dalseonensis]MDQ0435652.1 cytochrome c-type biogenesis protein CcmH [Kaistia dalseonensis]
MLFWIALAALTAAASLAVLVPLGRPAREHAAGSEAASIYRDQLDELARDRERGIIGPAEAEAARVEIARRLLKSDADAGKASVATRRGRVIAIGAAIIGLPLIAIGTYLAVGSPLLVDQPIASRAGQSPQDEVQDLVRRVEEHLAAEPEDGRGWEVIGPIYMRLGRFDDAARAFDNSRRLLGQTADRDALYGEALTRAHGDMVTADARAAFERALAQDPANIRARFYVAMALGQSGDKEKAIVAWNALIAAAPADAAWLPTARAQLATLQGQPVPAAPPAAAAAPGPTAADVAASASQTPEQRQQMIEGMVAGLAARLDQAPDDAEGWARLFRAYIVLGRPQDAASALSRARTALADKPALLAAVESAARENGITSN